MERIRLTQRMAAKNRQADSATPETPIDLGKNRPYHKLDEYHTFEPSLNHWEPDMRHEWKEDKHDETGFGIPKMAKVYMAAKKATKLAMMLLGEDASEDILEKQARAFMRMGDKALTASIDRWAECNCDNGVCDDTTVADEEPAQEEQPAVVEEAPVAPETTPAPAPAPAPEAVAPEAPAVDAPAPAPEAPATEEAAPAVKEEEPADIDFDDDVPDGADTTASAELEACFAADEEEEVAPVAEPATTASKKPGIKKLAGQPTLVRVASKKADDLEGIWDKWSNPDVR